jgi:hypothetical protein
LTGCMLGFFCRNVTSFRSTASSSMQYLAISANHRCTLLPNALLLHWVSPNVSWSILSQKRSWDLSWGSISTYQLVNFLQLCLHAFKLERRQTTLM